MHNLHPRPRIRPGRLFGGIFVSIVLLGCGSSDELLRSELGELEQRIGELERTAGRRQVQISEIQEDVLLLEDRVEAHRLSLERRGLVARRTVDELPAYEPPAGEPSYSYVANLPVQRVTPSSNTAMVPDESGGEELVIDNLSLDRFVAEHGGSSSGYGSTMSSSARTGPGHQPLPPVVTGERLTVTVSDQVALEPEEIPLFDSPLDLYQDSLQRFNSEQYEAALGGFRRFLEMSPAEDYRDNALYWIGECQYATGDYRLALASFQRVVDEFPDGNKVPDSLLKIGLTYERLNNVREASAVLSVLIETYPLTEAARRASQRLSELN